MTLGGVGTGHEDVPGGGDREEDDRAGDGGKLADVGQDCSGVAARECEAGLRTMRMGKTMPIRPLVRTFRAQQAAKPQQSRGGIRACEFDCGWACSRSASSRGSRG